MADPPVKSPNTLFSYFNSNKKKTTAESPVSSSKPEHVETEIVVKNDEKESKKRKKERLSLSNQAKKVRLSQSSADEADSGIASHPNSEPVEDVPTDDSVCEVSYIDFVTVGDKNGNQNESRDQMIASPEENRKSMMAFFSPKSGKKRKNIDDETVKKADEVKSPVSSPGLVEITGVLENQPKSQEKGKKKTQMTFDFSGKGMKLTKPEIEMEPVEMTSPTVEKEDIIIVSPELEEGKSAEQKTKKSKKKPKKKAKEVKEPVEASDDVVTSHDVIMAEDDVTDGNTAAEERDRPRRSLLDVMAEARQHRAKAETEIEEQPEDKPVPKRKQKVKKAKVEEKEEENVTEEEVVPNQRPRRTKRRNLAENDFVDPELEPEPKPKVSKSRKARESKRRESPPLKSPGGSDVLYKSELVESKKGPWTLRMTRLRSRQTTNSESKTQLAAQQILNKAKNKANAKVNPKIAKAKKVVGSKKGKENQKIDAKTKNLKISGVKSKTGQMASIFKGKKKLTKAEKKALEEEEKKQAEEQKRRDAFLQGGIPTALRQKVAKSIEASDSISVHLPFPGSGFDHTGYCCTSTSVSTGELGAIWQKINSREGVQSNTVKSLQWASACFTTIEKTHQGSKLEFKEPKKLSQEVIGSVLTQLEKETPDFPVRKVYESLSRRRENEIVKLESENQTSDVIALSDDEQSDQKSKLKRKKKKKTAEKMVVAKQLDDVIKRNCDVALTDMYAPCNLQDVVGNGQVKKKLNSWLSEWKERLDREERLLKKQLEKQMKKSSTNSKIDEDFADFQCSDEDMSTGAGLCNTLLIFGGHGIGKTSLVHAVAQELDYKVLELNATSRRNGKLVMSKLQEATQSQHVSKSTNSPCKTEKGNVFFAAKKNILEQAKSLEALANRPGSNSLSLILFDEVDIIFEEDKGFWQTIESFMKTTKKPMIMTTDDPNFRFHFEGQPVEELTLRQGRLDHVTQYLNLVCLVEGFLVKYSDLVNVVSDFKGDIRKCLNALHFNLLSGGSTSIETDRVLKTKAKIEIPVKKREQMLSQAGSDDDFQPLKMKVKMNVILDGEDSNDALVLNKDYHEISKHVGLSSSVSGFSREFWQLLSSKTIQNARLCDSGKEGIELLRANSRNSLPLPKEVISQSYPIFRRTESKKPNVEHRKRIVSDNLYDDERSNDEAFISMETDDVTVETDDVITSEPVVKKTVEVRVEEFVILEELARSYETNSVSDSFLSREAEVTSSHHVMTSPGLEDIQNFSSRNRAEETTYQMQFCLEAMNSKLLSNRLSKCQRIDPIPIEKNNTDFDYRLRGDFDLTPKLARELERCHNNVEYQLGPAVAMDTSAMVTDYMPTLRRIVKMENLKLTAKTKRRFFHYLDHISLDLSPSCLEMLSTSF